MSRRASGRATTVSRAGQTCATGTPGSQVCTGLPGTRVYPGRAAGHHTVCCRALACSPSGRCRLHRPWQTGCGGIREQMSRGPPPWWLFKSPRPSRPFSDHQRHPSFEAEEEAWAGTLESRCTRVQGKVRPRARPTPGSRDGWWIGIFVPRSSDVLPLAGLAMS